MNAPVTMAKHTEDQDRAAPPAGKLANPGWGSAAQGPVEADNAANLFNDDGVPRYVQLLSLFKRAIQSGEWRNGGQIATVEELAAHYGVARATIRRALGLLEDEGLIRRYRAKGTFVTYEAKQPIFWDLETDWSALLRPRVRATIEILTQSSTATLPLHVQLFGAPAVSYRRFLRRLSREGEPFLISDLFIAEDVAAKIPAKDIPKKSGFSLLASTPGVEVGNVHQTLTAGAADTVRAEQLRIPMNSPVIYVQRTALDGDGRIIMLSDGTYRGDIFRLDMRLK